MNVFDHAIERERVTEQLYREMAARAPQAMLQAVLRTMADQEARHARSLTSLKWEAAPSRGETDILIEARAGLDNAEKALYLSDLPATELEAYERARTLEAQSRAHYEELAAAETRPVVKGILTRLAAEETRHYELVNRIIHLLTTL